MARIGIYGGSFNPPHLGHIFAARKARQLLGLDKILLIPAAIPPHKAVAEGSPDGETRFALTQLAIAGETGMEVSRIELDRPGPSYTVDTLRKLRESYPQDELYLLMGTDMFLSFFQWREPEAIAALAVPVCMARVRADAALSAQLLAQQEKMEAVFGVRPIVLQNDCLEISSTEARRLLFFGIADEVLHPDVLAMIERERLYGVGGAYHALPFADLRRVSLSLHKEKRRAHAQGVSDTAVLLAKNTARMRRTLPVPGSCTISPRRSLLRSSKSWSIIGSCRYRRSNTRRRSCSTPRPARRLPHVFSVRTMPSSPPSTIIRPAERI